MNDDFLRKAAIHVPLNAESTADAASAFPLLPSNPFLLWGSAFRPAGGRPSSDIFAIARQSISVARVPQTALPLFRQDDTPDVDPALPAQRRQINRAPILWSKKALAFAIGFYAPELMT